MGKQLMKSVRNHWCKYLGLGNEGLLKPQTPKPYKKVSFRNSLARSRWCKYLAKAFEGCGSFPKGPRYCYRGYFPNHNNYS